MNTAKEPKNDKIKIREYEVTNKGLRKYLKRHSISTAIIRRSDRRVTDMHYCSACGRPLTGRIKKTDNYKASISYYRIKLDEYSTFYLCLDARLCEQYLKKHKHTDKLTVYKLGE